MVVELENQNSAPVEPRFLPVRIDPRDVVGWAKSMAQSPRFMSAPGHIVRFKAFGEPVYWCVTDSHDLIQKHHSLGRFYERDELDALQRFFPFGGTYVDIGSNIGNHAVYVAKFLRPARVIPFEPNPKAIELLVTNFILNNVEDKVDFEQLGVGVGTPADNMGLASPQGNLGATKLVEGSGDVRVVAGDIALATTKVDLVKIDVEGMEMQVLDSLTKTIARDRPNMMIEVDTANRALFQAWINDNSYQIGMRFQRFRDNQNFIITPKPQPTERPA